jgi:phage regulator Rha-like protein
MEEGIAKVDTVLIENRIFTIRDEHIMIDRYLADLYEVTTKRINEQVKRNIQRFPISFCFQLYEKERTELFANCDRFKNLKHSSSLPYVFTEQGVAMLSAVLRSETAVNVSIRIIDAFVEMRKMIAENSLVFNSLDKLEKTQLQNKQKFKHLFKALESGNIHSEKGIFYEGQIFDAYSFISYLVRKAEKSIILIGNYIDDSVLILFGKRNPEVTLRIYTKKSIIN